MGVILSYFRDKGSEKRLDSIDKRIKQLNQSINKHEYIKSRMEKIINISMIASTIVLISSGIFAVTKKIVICRKICLYSSIILILFYVFKMVINQFLNFWKTSKQKQLIQSHNSMKTELTRVVENEKYKVACQLLDKYDPSNQFVIRESLNKNQDNNNNSLNSQSKVELVNRKKTSEKSINNEKSPIASIKNDPSKLNSIKTNYQNYSLMNRLIDKLLGDSGSIDQSMIDNRYALICVHCKRHNGLISPNLFDSIEYICKFCNQLNSPKGLISQNIDIDAQVSKPKQN